MAAPIYTQAEADEMIAAEKLLTAEAFRRMLPAEIRNDRLSQRVEVLCEGELADRISFELDVQVNKQTDEVGATLIGSLDSRGNQGLCRYEIQRMSHYNRTPCNELLVPANVVHRHMYSEEAVRELHMWDACVEPLDEVPTGGPLARVRERILRKMIDDLGIRIENPDAEAQLF